jgi:hypothetical protein
MRRRTKADAVTSTMATAIQDSTARVVIGEGYPQYRWHHEPSAISLPR